MSRYFIAISLSDEVKECLRDIQPSAHPGIRLVGPDEFHLTLHFLSELSDETRELACLELESVKETGFEMVIRGVGFFSNHSRPTVLWTGVEPSPGLISIQRKVGAALTDAIGFKPETRPYSPHITLARINAPLPPGDLERYVKHHEGFSIPAFFVRRFSLFKSVFVDDAPRYREEARFDLI